MTDTIATRYTERQHLHIGILLFPEVEVLDFAGPFEVFSVASRIAAKVLGKAPFTVSLIGPGSAPVLARHGMGVVPHLSFSQADDINLLIVPGGVVDGVLEDVNTLDWVAKAARRAALVASVCTGAFVLAKLNLVDGLPVTTHWEDIPLLRAGYPALEVREGVPYVDNGRIVTSAGISAGIGMSLHLVERILGTRWAVATARQMEYDWTPGL